MKLDELENVIRNYPMLSRNYKELSDAIDKLSFTEISMFESEMTAREDRMIQKAEEIESQLTLVLRAIEQSNLNDRELAVIDWVMEGKSMRWVGDCIFNSSHTTVRRMFVSATRKIYTTINT